jgi:hypothetical protein
LAGIRSRFFVRAITRSGDPFVRAAAEIHELGRDAEAIAVAVSVAPDSRETIVHGAVAIVVDAVARLAGAWIDACLGIITVAAHRCEHWCPRARNHRYRVVPVAIAVGVDESVESDTFIHHAIAIVVDPVSAYLGCRGVHAGVHVVAVGAARFAVATGSVRRRVAVCIAKPIGSRIAVFIVPGNVADLGVTRKSVGIIIVAVVAAALELVTRPVAVAVPRLEAACAALGAPAHAARVLGLVALDARPTR